MVLTSLPEPLPVSEALTVAAELRRLELPLSTAVLNRMPEDPFTPESRAALRRMLAAHGPHQGWRELERLERARAASVRLSRTLRAPLLTLPELHATGPALVEALAEGFAPPRSTRPGRRPCREPRAAWRWAPARVTWAHAVSAGDLRRLLRDKRIVVLCGAGGVGKTTTAAALGVAAARAGRRVLVLTIDPARRLAETMGLQESGPEPTSIPPERLFADGPRGTGLLDVWMLDPRAIFERMVHQLAPTPEAARAIVDHRLYRFLSELVAGVQEYAAAEALDAFLTDGRYELILLDTPPAGTRWTSWTRPAGWRASWTNASCRCSARRRARGGRLWHGAQAVVDRVLAGIFGAGFTQEMRGFIGAFGGLFSGMRLHTERLHQRLASPDAAFLLVTSPEPASLREATWFRETLAARGLPFAGYVLNRSWAHDDVLAAPEALLEHTGGDRHAEHAVAALARLAAVEQERAQAHRDVLDRLTRHLPSGTLAVAAPDAGAELEEFSGLVRLGDALAAG
ncbi:ArsA-related P-loop ATPase [Myxococcus sp. MxC21-1]|uniref:ArsA family ATPase n=1 Tax=Myxococcus sp. MxC21-1 TaxID=3041439 RepID=UPI00292D0B88|nr:ArsA-related P-loop ATPase [Myxococcus sp. MxC21-1]WNZ62170.1 ArsA-related P-loop ATPase [Myxococcus sp. MxC21-1]